MLQVKVSSDFSSTRELFTKKIASSRRTNHQGNMSIARDTNQTFASQPRPSIIKSSKKSSAGSTSNRNNGGFSGSFKEKWEEQHFAAERKKSTEGYETPHTKLRTESKNSAIERNTPGVSDRVPLI